MQRKHLFKALGPGVIAGAADDDPAGIATYTVAGARFGLGLLWVSLITFPLMAAVQMACARIGMSSGLGLAAALRTRFPRSVVMLAAVALLITNTINIGADLAGMADAAEMFTRVDSRIYAVAFGLIIAIAPVWFSYRRIATVLKWLALSLFAYVITAFYVTTDWPSVLRAAVTPSIPKGPEHWEMLVAILGTTISPYLFFWQTSEEVEEEKSQGRTSVEARRGSTDAEVMERRFDIGAGTFFSTVVMFFIIVTAAFTLNAKGLQNIETSRQAAEALKPLAGELCSVVYAMGLIAVGMLAIPTLSGSAAYALAEVFGWPEGLNEKTSHARRFYGVIVVSTLLGMTIEFAGINPIRALVFSAVINGLLAPVLLLAILIVGGDRQLMAGQPLSAMHRATILLAAIVMAGAAVAMFVA